MTDQQNAYLVLIGIVVIMALARYMPHLAGWIVIALTFGLLLLATQKGVIGSEHR